MWFIPYCLFIKQKKVKMSEMAKNIFKYISGRNPLNKNSNL